MTIRRGTAVVVRHLDTDHMVCVSSRVMDGLIADKEEANE